jgi:hypothetical protein
MNQEEFNMVEPALERLAGQKQELSSTDFDAVCTGFLFYCRKKFTDKPALVLEIESLVASICSGEITKCN